MDPKFDKDDGDLDDTLRHMRALTDRPGDLSFRQSIATAFDRVTDRLGKIEVRLARIDERQLSRTTIAEMIQKELKPYADAQTRLEKVVWGLCGAVGTALVTLAVTRVFGK